MNVSGLVSLGGTVFNLIFGGKPGLVVGGVALSGLSAPSSAPFGGPQKVVRHELPGGVLVLNAMGSYGRNFEVSGILMGGQALVNARKLEALKVAGQAITVTWGDFTQKVLLENAEFDFQRLGWEIPYKLSGHVVPTEPVAAKLSWLQTFIKDASDALGLTSLQSEFSQVTDAIQQAQKYVPLLGAISPNLAAKASGILAGGSSIATGLGSVASGNLGGFNLVGNGVGGLASTIAAKQIQIGASAQTAATAATAVAYLQRSQKAVNAATTEEVAMAVKTVQVSATTLFKVAAAQYGDASQWWRIARANGLTDPILPGLVTLTIPAPDSSTAGDGLPLDGD